ncbi:MAG: excisionase [Blautia sp.]|nr:excisionase [Blautia sp.]
MINKRQELPWWQKYTLTLNEASEYFGIGYKKLKVFIQENADADFILWNGNRAQIKRERFQKYLDEKMNVI